VRGERERRPAILSAPQIKRKQKLPTTASDDGSLIAARGARVDSIASDTEAFALMLFETPKGSSLESPWLAVSPLFGQGKAKTKRFRSEESVPQRERDGCRLAVHAQLF